MKRSIFFLSFLSVSLAVPNLATTMVGGGTMTDIPNPTPPIPCGVRNGPRCPTYYSCIRTQSSCPPGDICGGTCAIPAPTPTPPHKQKCGPKLPRCPKNYSCVGSKPGNKRGVCKKKPQGCGHLAAPCPKGQTCVPKPGQGQNKRFGLCVNLNKAPFCGWDGYSGVVCPYGMQCWDKPGDECDPEAGWYDCPGICVQYTGKE